MEKRTEYESCSNLSWYGGEDAVVANRSTVAALPRRRPSNFLACLASCIPTPKDEHRTDYICPSTTVIIKEQTKWRARKTMVRAVDIRCIRTPALVRGRGRLPTDRIYSAMELSTIAILLIHVTTYYRLRRLSSTIQQWQGIFRHLVTARCAITDNLDLQHGRYNRQSVLRHYSLDRCSYCFA